MDDCSKMAAQQSSATLPLVRSGQKRHARLAGNELMAAKAADVSG
jgi:hypothetical protein